MCRSLSTEEHFPFCSRECEIASRIQAERQELERHGYKYKLIDWHTVICLLTRYTHIDIMDIYNLEIGS